MNDFHTQTTLALWLILSCFLPAILMMGAPLMALTASRHAWLATHGEKRDVDEVGDCNDDSDESASEASAPPDAVPEWSFALSAVLGLLLAWSLAMPLLYAMADASAYGGMPNHGGNFEEAGAWRLVLDHLAVTTVPVIILTLIMAAAISDTAWWFLPDRIVLPLLILCGIDIDAFIALARDNHASGPGLAREIVMLAAVPAGLAIGIHVGARLLGLLQVLAMGRMVICPPDIAILAIPFLLFPITGSLFDQLDLVVCFTLTACLVLVAGLTGPEAPDGLAQIMESAGAGKASGTPGLACSGKQCEKADGNSPAARLRRIIPFGAPMLSATGLVAGASLIMEMNGWR